MDGNSDRPLLLVRIVVEMTYQPPPPSPPPPPAYPGQPAYAGQRQPGQPPNKPIRVVDSVHGDVLDAAGHRRDHQLQQRLHGWLMFFYDIVGSGGRRLGQVPVRAGCVERGIDDESPASDIDHCGGPTQHTEGEVMPRRIHCSHARTNRSWRTDYSDRNRLPRAVHLRLRWRAVTTQPAQRWRQILRDALLGAARQRGTARPLMPIERDPRRGGCRERDDVRRDPRVGTSGGRRTVDRGAGLHRSRPHRRAATLRAEAAVLSDLLGDV